MCCWSALLFIVTSTDHCPQFTGLSWWAVCFNQTGHHQVPLYSHCTCFMQVFYDTINIDIMLKLIEIIKIYAHKVNLNLAYNINIIFPSVCLSLKCSFLDIFGLNFLDSYTVSSMFIWCTVDSSHSPLCYHCNDVKWKAQLWNLLFSDVLCLPVISAALDPNILLQCCVLKLPQLLLFTQREISSFMLI
jgi:hypothetical protein